MASGANERPVVALRAGHTLVELIVALAASALLVGGLASTVYIAGRAGDLAGPTTNTLRASEIALDLADELRYAVFVSERSEHLVQFAVADRSGDAEADVIRYEWSGTPGDPLIRTFNDGTPETMAEDVQEFRLAYTLREKTEEFATLVESEEKKLIEQTDASDANGFTITDSWWLGQYFHPDGFDAPLPEGAVSWSVTKVVIAMRRRDWPFDGKTWIQLRRATGDGKPVSAFLDETTIDEWSLSDVYRWMPFTFSGVSGLSPKRGLCLTCTSERPGSSSRILYDRGGPGGRVKSLDSGATWTYDSDSTMLYQIYGKYKTLSGTPHAVMRKYLVGAALSLQIGDQEFTRIRAGTNLLNSPEVLSGCWKLDFNNDPTTEDADYDGSGDWTTNTGTFDPARLSGGVWQADSGDGVELRTAPECDFTQLTTVELKCRNTGIGGSGAVFRMYVDRTVAAYGEISASVALQDNGTQTARIYTGPSTGAKLLVEVADLPSDFVDARLVIDPDADVVAVWVEGIFRGAYQYDRFSDNNNRYLLAEASGSDAEFDYVSIRLSDGS